METVMRTVAAFLACAVAAAGGDGDAVVWRLGVADGSSAEFRPCHAWEYGRAPWLATHPSMDAATHTFRYSVLPGATQRPEIPAEICGVHECRFMPNDEVVTGLALSWDEDAPGNRLLRFDCAAFSHSPDNGRGGVELSLSDGRKRVFDIPERNAEGKPFPFAMECVVPVAPGRNEATIRVVSGGKHERIVFDAITLGETDAAPDFPPILEAATSDMDGIFHPGTDARLRFRLFNATEGVAKYEVSDTASNAVFRGTAVIANGVGEAPLPTNRKGWFRVVAKLPGRGFPAGGGGVAISGSPIPAGGLESAAPPPASPEPPSAATAYCVVEPPEEGFRDDSRFGCHALEGDGYERPMTAFSREWTRRSARRARLAGSKWARLHYLTWPLAEPEPGRFDWDDLDFRLGVAEENGLRVLVNVAGVPRWCSPSDDDSMTCTGSKRWKFHPPKDHAEWARFVRALVSHCRGRVSDWEIGNEPGYTSAFWITGSPSDFGAYLATAYDAAHGADPDCRIYPGAPIEPVFIEEAVKSLGGRAPWDVFSAHYLGNSKRFSPRTRSFAEMNASFGRPPAIVNSEDMGWVGSRGEGPLAVAASAVKLHVRDAAQGVIRTFAFRIFHYGGGEYPFFTAESVPLPAFAAYRAMTHRLEGARYVGDVSTAQCEAYVFDRAGTPVTVFWNALSVPATFRATFGMGPFSAVDEMDNESPAVPGADGVLALSASSMPRYVEGGNWDAIQAAMEASAAERASDKGSHPLGENLVPEEKRTLSAKSRRFVKVAADVPVAYGEAYVLAATIRGRGTLDGIVTVRDADGTEIYPRRQGLNCLMNRHAEEGEWRTVSDVFTISDEKAASLTLVLVANFREEGSGSALEVRDATVARISETHSVSKALHRGVFGTDGFGPPIAIPGATARVALSSGDSGAQSPSFLRLRFEVDDDVFDPPDGPDNCWFKDCIQFAIDPGDDGADYLSFRLLRTAAGDGVLFKDHDYATPELPDDITRYGVIRDAGISFFLADGGYVFDVSVPVRELYPLKADQDSFGFDFLVNDSDGGPREWREWTEGIGGRKTAAPFGHLERDGGSEEKQTTAQPDIAPASTQETNQ